jgi:hypothetical protein
VREEEGAATKVAGFVDASNGRPAEGGRDTHVSVRLNGRVFEALIGAPRYGSVLPCVLPN